MIQQSLYGIELITVLLVFSAVLFSDTLRKCGYRLRLQFNLWRRPTVNGGGIEDRVSCYYHKEGRP